MAEVSADELVAVVEWLHAFPAHYRILLATPGLDPARTRRLAAEILVIIAALEKLIDTRKLKKPFAA